jgi:transcriptional antiterminator Rof (Rho-off)
MRTCLDNKQKYLLCSFTGTTVLLTVDKFLSLRHAVHVDFLAKYI